MKNLKLIPTLLATAILAGCGVVKTSSISEPSFASKGKKIEQSSFKTNIIAALEANEFYRENKNLASKIIKENASTENIQKRIRDKKTYYSSDAVSTADYVIEYDSKQVLVKSDRKINVQNEVESDSENSKIKNSLKETTFFEEGTGENANRIVKISEQLKEYSVSDPLAANETVKNRFDANISENFLSGLKSTKLMHYAEATDVSSTTFYQNKNVFTVSYKEVLKDTEKDVIDGETVETMKYEISRTFIAQADLTNGAEKIKISEKQISIYTVLVDYNAYKKDEIIEKTTTNYVEFSAFDKDLELKRIDDLSGYKKVNS